MRLSLLLSLLPLALAQGYIPHITGLNNLTSAGFGYNSSLPDLANAALFNTSSPSGCGTLPSGVPIDTASELDKASAAGLPMAGKNGSVWLLWRALGAGGQNASANASAEWDPTGSGQNFTPIALLANHAGNGAAGTDQLLTVQLPEHANCTSGTGENACLLRVRVGQGGSCFAVASYNASLPSGADSATADSSTLADDEEEYTPTRTTNARPSPSKVASGPGSGSGSAPSGVKRARTPKHALVERRTPRAAKGARMKGGVGSAWGKKRGKGR